jgi:hypothetical protein
MSSLVGRGTEPLRSGPRPGDPLSVGSHGRQFRDNLLHVLPVLSPAGDLVDALAEFLRRLGARPPLHKMPAWVPLDAPLLRIVHPRNTKLSLPRLKSTNRVFAGCSVNPSRFITNPIRRSASLAADSVRHMATRLFDTPLHPDRISPPGWSLLPGAPAFTRAGLSPARTARLSGRTMDVILGVISAGKFHLRERRRVKACGDRLRARHHRLRKKRDLMSTDPCNRPCHADGRRHFPLVD